MERLHFARWILPISSSFLQNVTPEVAAFSQDVHMEYGI